MTQIGPSHEAVSAPGRKGMTAMPGIPGYISHICRIYDVNTDANRILDGPIRGQSGQRAVSCSATHPPQTRRVPLPSPEIPLRCPSPVSATDVPPVFQVNNGFPPHTDTAGKISLLHSGLFAVQLYFCDQCHLTGPCCQRGKTESSGSQPAPGCRERWPIRSLLYLNCECAP